MMDAWLLLIILGIAISISLWLRTRHIRSQLTQGGVTASPLSQAIQELVGTAGGIYLAIIALTSFLKIEIPERISLFQVSFDPLAFIAIGIAIIQPIVIRLFEQKGR